jgi:hypothetical protein
MTGTMKARTSVSQEIGCDDPATTGIILEVIRDRYQSCTDNSYLKVDEKKTQAKASNCQLWNQLNGRSAGSVF